MKDVAMIYGLNTGFPTAEELDDTSRIGNNRRHQLESNA